MFDWPEGYPSIEELQIVINETIDGDYELHGIFGFMWHEFESPTAFGQLFKKAIENNVFHGIYHHGKNSNNHEVYRIQH